MPKKSQVSVFVIIALVVLFGGALAYFGYTRIQPQKEQISQAQLAPVTSYVGSCLEKTATDAVIKLGRQGRLYSDAYLSSESERIAYFYYKGDGFFPPSISVLENDVSRYIRENIKSCVGDFSSFPFNITDEPSQIKVATVFGRRQIVIDAKYPVSVKADGAEAKLLNFKASVGIELTPIYELAREIYKNTKKDPAWIELSLLSTQPNYRIRLLKISEDILIYEISDINQKLDNQQYIYRFAVKYNM